MSDLVVVALVAALCLGLGLAVRRWWLLAAACGPSFVWLLLSLPGWTEEDSDGATGAQWFFVGLLYVGVPIILLVALGVWVGRRLWR